MSKVLATPVPRAEWAPLPRPDCRGVEFKVLLQQPALVLAMLRFAPHATVDEHPANFPIDVICLEGAGMFSVQGESAPLRAGESVPWPPHQPHCLWTDDSTMTTLMVEHRDAAFGPHNTYPDPADVAAHIPARGNRAPG